MKEGTVKIIGTQQPLGSSPETNHQVPAKSGQVQMTGTVQDMSPNPVPLQNKGGVKEGTFKAIGDVVKLNTKPEKGWSDVPSVKMSERTSQIDKKPY